ncbi:hypothetical protein DFJ58DRAFT_764607 [Suillus subalutaceus]|uniref:uncharacterized protein n=1 Tax=Suillus subalutaceus TaxID=48586 RepID=UPI001B8778B1|nr:uncharacterized protein DFJ58DRAFT_764607 [Suillus subalutaceus]KAG1870782.1 hypothetical protein DFJ58DRAFT_764607 [Suillus subalutaceus]
MDTQPGSSRAFPPDTVSSYSTTNFSAQHLRRPPRSTAQHRRHSYVIPGSKASTQKLRRVPENSSFGTDTGVGGPLSADQRIFTVLSPDASRDPISGGTYGNIYKCLYHGSEGDAEVAVKAIRPQFFSVEMFRRELGIWKRLRHSNILKFMGTTSDFGLSLRDIAAGLNYRG